MPFVALVLVMVGVTAMVALRSAGDDAARLATRLHQEASAGIRMRLDDYLARSVSQTDAQRADALVPLLRSQAIGAEGRAFILDDTGAVIASSAANDDAVVASAVAGLVQHTGPTGLSRAATEFRFDHVTARPLSRETWLTYATRYREQPGGRHWTLVTAMPEAFYLAGMRAGSSRAAMVFALALALSLVLAAALASMVTAPLRRIARATQAMARGDLSTRVPGSSSKNWAPLRNRSTTWPAGSTRRSRTWSAKSTHESGVSTNSRKARRGCAKATTDCNSPFRPRGSASGIGTCSRIGLSGTTRCTACMASTRRSSPAPSTPGHGASCPKTCHRPRSARSRAPWRPLQHRLQGAAGRRRDPHHSRRGASHPQRGRPAGSHGRYQRDVTDRIRAERDASSSSTSSGSASRSSGCCMRRRACCSATGRSTARCWLKSSRSSPLRGSIRECCHARIVHGDLEVTTKGWRESPWKQTATFTTSEGTGVIEIVYLEECPSAAEGPFLIEERALLDSCAEMLVAYL